MGRRVFALACALVALSCSDNSSSLNGGGSSSGDTASSSGSNGDTSSSSSGASGSSGATTPASICVATINEYRHQQGLPAYTEWTAIESCSDGEAKSDGSTNSPHGAFPGCGESAQNECPSWPGPASNGIVKCLDYMWSLGPGEGHHDNMASRTWTKAACGFYTLPNGSFWSVQNFR